MSSSNTNLGNERQKNDLRCSHQWQKKSENHRRCEKCGLNQLGYKIQEKSDTLLPERLAIRLCDELGLILRSKVVWAKQVMMRDERDVLYTKGSVMPASVKDRFNTSWEYLFHFTKEKRYYFDLDAVRLRVQTIETWQEAVERKNEGNTNHSGLEINATWDKSGAMYNPNGKNLPNVWLIGTEPSKELHFARFPTALCEIPIMATCPEKICKVCGKIREKITEQVDARIQKPRKFNKAGNSDRNDTGRVYVEKDTKVIGYTSCGHNDYEPGIVLDPFCGSGTALQVAQRLGRNYLGIELNKDYIKISEDKLKQKTLRI